MMAIREPFVSGPPSEPRHAPLSAEHRSGMELLGLIRALARDEVDRLRESTTSHFDGVERHAADDVAIAQSAVHATTVRLVDIIVSDEALKTFVTARLGKAVPR